MKSKKEKELEQELERKKALAQAFTEFDMTIRKLDAHAEQMKDSIDSAAIRNDIERVKVLISQRVAICQVSNFLRETKENLMLGVHTAQALASLKNLPGAVSACKGLLSEMPDIEGLKKMSKKVFSDMQKATSVFQPLNDALSEAVTPKAVYSSLLDGSDITESEQYKAEYEAMLERVKSKVAPDPIAKAAESKASNTGEIDYAGLIDEENKKK